MLSSILRMNNRIRNKRGAAGYIELLIVFSWIIVILTVTLSIVRVILIKMNVMDIVRSELRVIEVVGKIKPENAESIKERLNEMGLLNSDGSNCSIVLYRTPYIPDGTITIGHEEYNFNAEKILEYRDAIKLQVSVQTQLKLPMINLEIKEFGFTYGASYTGTVQRYNKK